MLKNDLLQKAALRWVHREKVPRARDCFRVWDRGARLPEPYVYR